MKEKIAEARKGRMDGENVERCIRRDNHTGKEKVAGKERTWQGVRRGQHEGNKLSGTRKM